MKRLKETQKSPPQAQEPLTEVAILAENLEVTIRLQATGGLYAFAVNAFIGRVIRDYLAASLNFIKTGAAKEKWSIIKQSLIKKLDEIVVDIVRTHVNGSKVKSQLLTDLNDFKNENIPAARKDFKDVTQTPEPNEGSMELHYLPGIESAIDIIYRIFVLYQIENATREDLWVSSEGGALNCIIGALAFAEEKVNKLLHKYDPETLHRVEKLLDKIEADAGKIRRAASAAESVTAQPKNNQINPTLLLAVDTIFKEAIAEHEKVELDRAIGNPITRTKNFVIAGAWATAQAATQLMTAVGKLQGWALDQMVKTEGPQTLDQDDEDDMPGVRVDEHLVELREDHDGIQAPPGTPSSPVQNKMIHSPALSRRSTASSASQADVKADQSSARSASPSLL